MDSRLRAGTFSRDETCTKHDLTSIIMHHVWGIIFVVALAAAEKTTMKGTFQQQPLKVWSGLALMADGRGRAAGPEELAHIGCKSEALHFRVWPETKTGASTASHVLLLTSLDPAEYPAKRVGALYRLRWQVEIAFKRLKSLLHRDTLRARDPELARALIFTNLNPIPDKGVCFQRSYRQRRRPFMRHF